MNVRELNENQLGELKSKYFYDVENEYEYVDEVPNELVYEYFDGICFTEDDFCCSAGQYED